MKNGTSLRTLVESQHTDTNTARRMAAEKLVKWNDAKDFTPQDYSLRELYEQFVHPDPLVAREALSTFARTGNPYVYVATLGEAIDVSAFDKVQGNIILNEMRIGWDLAPNLLSSKVRTMNSSLIRERIPGYGLMTDYGYGLHPGAKIPEATFGQWYTDTADTEKSALMCDVSWEAQFFDKLGEVLGSARMVGDRLALNKEKRIAGCVAGVNVTLGGKVYTANNYNLRKSGSVGGAFNTYSTSSQTTSGVTIAPNALASTPIVDEVALESLAQLATNQVHPDTGERLAIRSQLKDLIVMPQKVQTVERFTSAREVRNGTQTNAFQTYGPRYSALGNYAMTVSDVLFGVIVDSGVAAANAADWYFLTNLEKGFVYIQNRPLSTEVCPANTGDMFSHDLVYRVRAIEQGVPQSLGPWFNYKGYNS